MWDYLYDDDFMFHNDFKQSDWQFYTYSSVKTYKKRKNTYHLRNRRHKERVKELKEKRMSS